MHARFRQSSLRALQAGDQLAANQDTDPQVPRSLQTLCESLLVPPPAALVNNIPSLRVAAALSWHSCRIPADVPATPPRLAEPAGASHVVAHGGFRAGESCACTWGEGGKAHANAMRRVGTTRDSPATLPATISPRPAQQPVHASALLAAPHPCDIAAAVQRPHPRAPTCASPFTRGTEARSKTACRLQLLVATSLPTVREWLPAPGPALPLVVHTPCACWC